MVIMQIPVKMLVFGLMFCVLPVFAANMTPADKETYEKLGLSEAEWGLVLDSHMPMSKVEFLLKSGISISEYFKHPWTELSLSEGEWIAKRKSGMSDAEMSVVKPPPAKEGGSYIFGFLFPGCYQLSKHETGKGWIMSGVTLGMIGFCAVHSMATKRFEPLGLFFIVPVMVWSGIDMGIQINAEQNPTAQRFSLQSPSANNLDKRISLSLNFNVK